MGKPRVWMYDDIGPKCSDGEKEHKLTVECIDNHIYFYSHVDSDRCLALIREIRETDNDLRRQHVSRGLGPDFPLVPIMLHINSHGGSLLDALSVADQLSQITSPVYSIVEGVCASAGTFISMACNKRLIVSSAFMLIHQFSSIMWGTYEEFRDDMKMQDKLMETVVSFYTSHSKMGEDVVREYLKRDTWLNAKESLELGIVDEIIPSTPGKATDGWYDETHSL